MTEETKTETESMDLKDISEEIDKIAHVFRRPVTKVDCFVYTEVDSPDMAYYLYQLQKKLDAEKVATQVVVFDDPKTAPFSNTYGVQNLWVVQERPEPFYKASLAAGNYLALCLKEMPRLTYEDLCQLVLRSLRYKTPNVKGKPKNIEFVYFKA